MMNILLPALVVAAVGGVGLRLWYRSWRRRRIAARRRVEAPNSHYSSRLVRDQEDRERWGGIDVSRLHPLNRDEVHRLLVAIDTEGISVLSAKDRLFLDNMTLPRLG